MGIFLSSVAIAIVSGAGCKRNDIDASNNVGNCDKTRDQLRNECPKGYSLKVVASGEQEQCADGGICKQVGNCSIECVATPLACVGEGIDCDESRGSCCEGLKCSTKLGEPKVCERVGACSQGGVPCGGKDDLPCCSGTCELDPGTVNKRFCKGGGGTDGGACIEQNNPCKADAGTNQCCAPFECDDFGGGLFICQ